MARVRRAGAEGEILLRADTGFWNANLFQWLRAEGIAYSIGVKLQAHVRDQIEAIDEESWTPLTDYPDTGEAEIAETTLGRERLIVRRVRTFAVRAELYPDWRYFAFATNRGEAIARRVRAPRPRRRRDPHLRSQGRGARPLPLGQLQTPPGA